MVMDHFELAIAAVKGTFQALLIIIQTIFRIFVPKTWDVKGKVVLITGSGGGLGRLVAMKLGSLGCKVVLWDINKEQNDETARLVRLSSKFGAEAYPYICDVSDKETVYKIAEDVKSKVGPVDILINNAGIVQGTDFQSLNDNDIIKTFNVNALSQFWTCKAFLPAMKEKNSGHIVSVSSVAGRFASIGLSDYTASKFAVVGFHESLMLELISQGYDGITGSLVCPFFINTGMFDGVEPPFPLLEADYAADTIVSMVLHRKSEIMFPCYFNFLRILASIMPFKAFASIYLALKGDSIMKNFKGHKSQ